MAFGNKIEGVRRGWMLAAGPVVGLLMVWGYRYWSERAVSFVDVRDSFDSPELSGIWETTRIAPGELKWQTEVVRQGRGALELRVRTGDRFEAGQHGGKDSERSELAEVSRLYSREDVLYEFAFSLYLPADFPVVPTRLVLAQWKQDCDGHPQCDDASPVVALRYSGGVLQVTRQSGEHRVALFETREPLRGRWTDFRFQLLFTPTARGVVRVWMNGRQVVRALGPTAYPEDSSTGYARPSRFYFKTGLYRDTMAEPMRLFLDEYSKREVKQD